MGAIFGGKLPLPPAFVPGGFTTSPRAERISAFKNYLSEITAFIRGIYLPDVEQMGSVYSDYFALGTGCKNLLAFGVFDLEPSGNAKLLRRGLAKAGSTSIGPVDTKAITEKVTYSWYADSTNNLNPTSGMTRPVYPKGQAYSWLKAPRYQGIPFEVGPLARMWVNGDYRRGISVMDRHLSRAEEALKIAEAMEEWVNGLQVGGAVYREYRAPTTGSGVGLTEAPRGALGHWHKIASSKTNRYQIITPTCWNASPRDTNGLMGPIEQALIGLPVQNPEEPVEVARVIHSFDPCLSCAVHVLHPARKARVFALRPFAKA
jgi:hydrogenase large subunit